MKEEPLYFITLKAAGMTEQLVHQNILLAIIIKNNHHQDGIKFFTPDEFSQQLAYMSRPKGHIIEPHIHKHLERRVVLTQEVLVIKSGKLRVDFYDNNQNYIDERILSKGDVILLAAGGHGFEILEDAEIIEIKQGPYVADDDKIRFSSPVMHKKAI